MACSHSTPCPFPQVKLIVSSSASLFFQPNLCSFFCSFICDVSCQRYLIAITILWMLLVWPGVASLPWKIYSHVLNGFHTFNYINGYAFLELYNICCDVFDVRPCIAPMACYSVIWHQAKVISRLIYVLQAYNDYTNYKCHYCTLSTMAVGIPHVGTHCSQGNKVRELVATLIASVDKAVIAGRIQLY